MIRSCSLHVITKQLALLLLIVPLSLSLGCQSQGDTLEEAIANIKEAIELYLETLPADERDLLLSSEILTTAVEVNAKSPRWTAAEAERALQVRAAVALVCSGQFGANDHDSISTGLSGRFLSLSAIRLHS